MAQISDLTKNILEKVESQAKADFEKEEVQLQAQLKEKTMQLKDRADKEKATIDERGRRELERLKQGYDNDLRNHYLAEKQSLIQSTYQKAIEQLAKLPEDDFLGFILGALAQLPEGKDTEIILGSLSSGQMHEALLAKVQESYPQVRLASRTLPKQAGFILSQKGMDYNFTFDQLIKEREGELASAISSRVFK